MKTLIIYTNQNIDSIKNENYDIIIDDTQDTVNKLYYECPKIYCYYLFVDYIINLFEDELDNIIDILKEYKPAILEISTHVKIYHRSVIHYVYPLLDYKKFSNYIYDIQEIIEEPLRKHTYYLHNIHIANKGTTITKKIVWDKLYHWFGTCIKKRYNIFPKYEIINGEIEKINFLNTFDIYKYFRVDHQYFKMKRIKFHKNNKEMYGLCSMHHFRHDFHNINRNSIINHLIKKYNYKIYLEIGVYNCAHFNEVYITEKYGVDPSPKEDDPTYMHWKDKIYKYTSVEFFKKLDKDEKFDIIFIDGCLYEYNVMTDIENSLLHLNDNGTILLHDCNPPIEFLQRDNYNMRYHGRTSNKIIWNNRTYTDRHWNGKAWKIITKLRSTRDDLEVYVVDADWGVGIIRKGQQELFKIVNKKDIEKYETFIKYRKYMLNLITPEKFLEIFN